MAEVLPLLRQMVAKFYVIGSRNEDEDQDSRSGAEDRYRFPAHEEVWEVSCPPARDGGGREKLRDAVADRRRAS